MIFKQAIRNTPDLQPCFQQNLAALGANANHIRIHAGTVSGSVDMDACLRQALPNEPRWDYAFGMFFSRGNEKIYYIEVHPGLADRVEGVKNKFYWLLEWLGQNAPALSNHLNASEFYWIASGGLRISPNTPQAREIAELGIELIPSLDIHAP
ncbi:MAG: hypothetical protein GY862_39660 [Gammaproteobacteria bacterium]|nr:hypothetical protein [Gammaproteobacteria bacterium]